MPATRLTINKGNQICPGISAELCRLICSFIIDKQIDNGSYFTLGSTDTIPIDVKRNCTCGSDNRI